MQGVMVRWMPEKNFGFCKVAGESHDVFVHGKSFVMGKPHVGATIRFDLFQNNHPSERLCATNVRVVSESRQ